MYLSQEQLSKIGYFRSGSLLWRQNNTGTVTWRPLPEPIVYTCPSIVIKIEIPCKAKHNITIYIYEDISIRGITEAEIYFEPRHQFESILLLKILWSFSINHFEALFLIQWLPQHIITYCYREFAKISICFILYYMIEIRNYVYFTSLCI